MWQKKNLSSQWSSGTGRGTGRRGFSVAAFFPERVDLKAGWWVVADLGTSGVYDFFCWAKVRCKIGSLKTSMTGVPIQEDGSRWRSKRTWGDVVPSPIQVRYQYRDYTKSK